MKPADITLSEHSIVQGLISTLGRAEHEFVAALIVRWHRVQGLKDWAPVSRDDIARLFDAPDPIVAAWARNPFWRPDPGAFAASGYIDGWQHGPASKGTLTPRFFNALDAEHARRRELRL